MANLLIRYFEKRSSAVLIFEKFDSRFEFKLNYKTIKGKTSFLNWVLNTLEGNVAMLEHGEVRALLRRIRELKALIRVAERGIIFHQNRINNFEGLVPVPEGLIQNSQVAIASCRSQIANWWPEFVDQVRQAVVWGLGKLPDDRNPVMLCSNYADAHLLQVRTEGWAADHALV